MAASAQQAAPMGPGMAAERSEDLQGSDGCLWPPLLSLAAPMGQEWPLSGQRICKGQMVAPMGQESPLSGAKDLKGSDGRPVPGLCSAWPPRWGQEWPLSG